MIGFGCNVATANQSLKYQSYFANGAKKPLVLGWQTTMTVPSSGASVNERFFDQLVDYAKGNSKVPAKGQLEWFYDNDPMALIRAWGHGVALYRGTAQKKLWEFARARHHDGTYYKYEYKAGVVEPVAA